MSGETARDMTYAMDLANHSYDWYRSHAVRSRKTYRSVEVAILTVSVAIPVAASISPHNVMLPAILGAVTVILSGSQSIFHWHENYLRFSRAREDIERERRLYHTGASPYQEPDTREQLLAQAVSRIEQGEMSGWIKVVSQRSRS
jgi:Protein of unknown function (DUF4231)